MAPSQHAALHARETPARRLSRPRGTLMSASGTAAPPATDALAWRSTWTTAPERGHTSLRLLMRCHRRMLGRYAASGASQPGQGPKEPYLTHCTACRQTRHWDPWMQKGTLKCILSRKTTILPTPPRSALSRLSVVRNSTSHFWEAAPFGRFSRKSSPPWEYLVSHSRKPELGRYQPASARAGLGCRSWCPLWCRYRRRAGLTRRLHSPAPPQLAPPLAHSQ